MDVTANLPDEVLREIVSYLPLSDKLRLESVNHKFQRCILKEMRLTPIPLVIDFANKFVNGHDVAPFLFSPAIQSLCLKAKFNALSICNVPRDWCELMDETLNTLMTSENKCLDPVTRFQMSVVICSPEVFQRIIAQFPRLSTVKLEHVRAVDSDTAIPLGLGTALQGKALTELALIFLEYSQQELLGLFKAIKPKTLRRIELSFHDLVSFNMAQLVDELHADGWAALLEMSLRFEAAIAIDLAQMFAALRHVRTLRKCDIYLYKIHPTDQFIPAMTSLFSNSIDLTVKCFVTFFAGVPACQIVNSIRQLQQVHSALQVQFDTRKLELMLQGMYFEERFLLVSRCDDANCVQCNSFYLVVLDALTERANSVIGGHLHNYQLDKCRISHVVGDLNALLRGGGQRVRALEIKEDASNHLVSILFETPRRLANHKFYVSITSAQCFSNACLPCFNFGE